MTLGKDPAAAPVEAPSTAVSGGNSPGRNATLDGVAGAGRGNGAPSFTPNIGSSAEADALNRAYGRPTGGERYAHIAPNGFHRTVDQPISTFGADVDTASYTNVRRFLSLGRLPPRDAVRVEEFVNYFRFDYPVSGDGRPIALTTEVGECPWAPSHRLVLIGARAKTPAPREVEGRSIVLLIDVSGSMAPPERLPLIKTALAQFVDTLRPDDRLAIATYAGYSGVALPPTPARERGVIQRAIANLGAGGSTNGASGLILAYRLARQAFVPGGVNRVILATDGDFNVGVTSTHDLVRLIERERESGIFLSVFGVGSGNLNDAMMEQIADRGNGHYAYLDSLQEARRVLVHESEATLEAVAKDVKFQVEFNPSEIAAWKQIGYENRRLAAEDFNDDRKDAGEMGAGHAVTVLYEVVPAGADDVSSSVGVDPLKYQPSPPARAAGLASVHANEWLTVKVRYKLPDEDRSELFDRPVRPGARVQHLPLAAAVAEFGLLLRDDARHVERWEALSRRVAALEVPRTLTVEKAAFAELVEIAKGLSRTR
jgi:Ca-activated chloride channel family protein